MALRKSRILAFSKSHISAALQQIFMKNFLGTLLWQKSKWYFMVHVLTPHQFWEKKHGWNHGNPKMALSLPLISQMVGIWAMTHKDTIDLWVTFVYHSRFGGLPFRGSWDTTVLPSQLNQSNFFDILIPLAKWNMIICLLRTFLENALKKQNFPFSPLSLHCACISVGNSVFFFSS